jgi:DNA-binding response OmpR family regulator
MPLARMCVIVMRLLVAEVDTALAEFLKSRLQQENFVVHVLSHSDQFAGLPESPNFDLILLDTGLPGLPAVDSAHC